MRELTDKFLDYFANSISKDWEKDNEPLRDFLNSLLRRRSKDCDLLKPEHGRHKGQQPLSLSATGNRENLPTGCGHHEFCGSGL